MNSAKSILKVVLNGIIIVALSYGLYHFVFNIWLSSYTNHNEYVEVPDLSNMNIQQATQILDDLGLTYEVDSVRFDPAIKPYAVMDYYPSLSAKVKEGRRIFIKANPKTHRPVELPDLIGKSKRLALTQLDISGLKVGNIIYEPDIAKDAVLKIIYNGKVLKPGDVLPRFAVVDLVLGRGMLTGVRTPNLVGLNLTDAKKMIKDNFFEVGQIKFLGESRDTIGARIVYQFPFSGDAYDQGQPIDIWLSNKTMTELKDRIKELDLQYKKFDEDTIQGSRYLDMLNKNNPQPKQEEQIQTAPTTPTAPKVVEEEIIIE
jgi:eukaryotic-like serine/threonine-protein kinase